MYFYMLLSTYSDSMAKTNVLPIRILVDGINLQQKFFLTPRYNPMIGSNN